MKGINKKTLLFAFAFSALSGAAFAAGESSGAAAAQGGGAGSASGGATFEALDQDGNGYLDEQEATGVPGLEMEQADTDGDGQLSRSEAEAAMPEGGASGSTESEKK